MRKYGGKCIRWKILRPRFLDVLGGVRKKTCQRKRELWLVSEE